MNLASEMSAVALTSRERSRLALYRIATSLACRPETIVEAAGSDHYPDETAELVRLWFKLKSDEARDAVLEQSRAIVAKVRG